MSLVMLCAVLIGLALLDSATYGTLLIPLWLLMRPGRLRVGRIVLYLGIVAGGYFLIGVLLQLGAAALLEAYREMLTSPTATLVQFWGGLTLVLLALIAPMFRRRRKLDRADRLEPPQRPGLLGRIRQRAVGPDAERGPVLTTIVPLALLAVVLEVATLFPYLGAIGLMTQHGPGFPGTLVLLAGYCLIMVAPAAALTGARARWGQEFEEPLRWIEAQAGSATARSASLWTLGVLGAVLAGSAAYTLWW
ncbi:MAG: GAP family protein [Micrococcaceae bacterium]